MNVVVIETGVANIASICAGLERAGAVCFRSDSVRDAVGAERVVLPGVGTFGAACEKLAERGLGEVLRERVLAGRPTLAVCVGHQVLFSASEESPGTAGLGLFPQTVRRFPEGVRVPHFGWNRITPGPGSRLLEPGYSYFANSYRAEQPPEGWQPAYTEHGGRFVAALERGPVLSCQFHPELSGSWGVSLLRRWLALTEEQ